MNRTYVVSFIVITFVCLFHITQAGEVGSNPIMPQELLVLAGQYGYSQIDDFYMNKPGGIEPCYVYDFLPLTKRYEEFISAVFWCKKSGADGPIFCLFFAKRSSESGYLEKYDIIENASYPRGLSLYKDSTATLNEFVYFKSNKRGPEDVHLDGYIIRNDYDGLATDFYNYEGEWLIRKWD